jgi:hypothetical protein
MATGAFAVAEHVKPCIKCGARDRYAGTGECRPCQNANSKRWRTANPERSRAIIKAWHAKNPASKASSNRAWNASNPERAAAMREARRKANPERVQALRLAREAKRSGFLEIDYETQLAFQNGICPGCLRAPTGHRLCRDHNHETGAIRGLLCKTCNVALGVLSDDPAILRRLAAYLERPPYHAWVRSVADDHDV